MTRKFLATVPDPFTDAERAAFARRVTAALPRRPAVWRPVLVAMAATALLAVGVVFMATDRLPEPAALAPVTVENPLRLAGAGPIPMTPLLFPSPSAPPVPPAPVDIPFAIAKTDHRVLLTWQGAEGTRYIVQKCLLSSNGKVCRTQAVVTGDRFVDPSREEAPLVLYTVEAVRS